MKERKVFLLFLKDLLLLFSKHAKEFETIPKSIQIIP
jgi:hypothetical protein